MAATSSSRQLGDLALVWDPRAAAADLQIIDGDLATDPGLETAMLLSLFTDRRAQPDDAPPSGDPSDRGGWWADAFAEVEGDLVGSRLWLLDRAPRSAETSRRAEEYTREALAWLLEDRVASALDVAIDLTGEALMIGVTVHRPERDAVTFRFARAWNSTT